MTEKRTFSDLVAGIPAGAKACANCVHARIALNPAVMRQLALCKALPPSPVVIPGPGGRGFGVAFHFPSCELHEECDLFEAKSVPNVPSEGPLE